MKNAHNQQLDGGNADFIPEDKSLPSIKGSLTDLDINDNYKNEETETLNEEVESDESDINIYDINVYASKEEIYESVENAYKTIPKFEERILHFTLGQIRYYFNSNTIRNQDAGDVVNTVMKSILELKRKWYKYKITDFHKFLRLSILSYIRNQWKKKDKIEEVAYYDDENNLTSETATEIVKEYARQDIGDAQHRDKLELLIKECLDAFSEDVFAHEVLEAIIEGVKSNIEISQNLGLSVAEVENAKKRIRTKLKFLKDKVR